MRKNAQKVLQAFNAGQAANEKTISTNGKELFSYAMLIARKNGDKVELIDYSKAPSNTTRSQVNAVRQFFPASQIVVVESF